MKQKVDGVGLLRPGQVQAKRRSYVNKRLAVACQQGRALLGGDIEGGVVAFVVVGVIDALHKEFAVVDAVGEGFA